MTLSRHLRNPTVITAALLMTLFIRTVPAKRVLTTITLSRSSNENANGSLAEGCYTLQQTDASKPGRDGYECSSYFREPLAHANRPWYKCAETGWIIYSAPDTSSWRISHGDGFNEYYAKTEKDVPPEEGWLHSYDVYTCPPTVTTTYTDLPDVTIDVPDAFLCPITKDVMADPVILADGHTYERTAIIQWFRHKQTSPKTNKVIPKKFQPNRALKNAIQALVGKSIKSFDFPDAFVCPINNKVMTDPVILNLAVASDTYERTSITKRFYDGDLTNPFSGKLLWNRRWRELKTNWDLKKAIEILTPHVGKSIRIRKS